MRASQDWKQVRVRLAAAAALAAVGLPIGAAGLATPAAAAAIRPTMRKAPTTTTTRPTTTTPTTTTPTTPTPTTTAPTTTTALPTTATLATAGDIACGPTDPNFNGGNGKPGYCQEKATAQEIAAMKPQYLLPLGDTQYDPAQVQGQQPTSADYRQGYDASWGSLTGVAAAHTHPITGNHEYGDVVENQQPPLSNGSNYFSNFGPQGLNELPSSVTGPSNDWYSWNIALQGKTWHVIDLDSECGVIGGCGAGSPEETWLRSDLAANANACTIVGFHEPRWSAGPWGTDNTDMADVWDDVVAAHVSLTLAGHIHDYQHFGPLDDNGQPSASGVPEFIVGTGGVDLEGDPGGPYTGMVASDWGDFGVLKLSLGATGASYAYQTTAGTTVDAGTAPCSSGGSTSGGSPSTGGPTVSSVSPGYGPATGTTPVTITGTGFAAGDTVHFGTTPATAVTVTSPTTITATAPAGTATVDVTVTDPTTGTSPTTAADEYTYTEATNGYSVTLTDSATTATVGSSVTLTATANQDVGPTPYGIWVYDVTTGALVIHQPSGITATATVTQTAAGTHRYVAYISNTGPTNIQATSTPTTTTWS